MRCGRDGQALRAAYPRGKGTLNLMPVGANMMIEPLLKSPSNRLPAVSKARAKGPFSPEAKALLVPSGANLKIVPLLVSACVKIARRGEDVDGNEGHGQAGHGHKETTESVCFHIAHNLGRLLRKSMDFLRNSLDERSNSGSVAQ